MADSTESRLAQLIISVLLLQVITAERKDGDYVIGAILAIHKDTILNCSQVDYKSLAVSEAIRFAVDEINVDHKLLGKLTVARQLGYDLRDSCGGVETEKNIAYSFNEAVRKFKVSGSTSKKPVSAVIGTFSRKSSEIMRLLKFEKIPQLSYDAENANLLQDDVSDDISDLLSLQPADTSKSSVTMDIIDAMQFRYTTIMAKNDFRGRSFLSALEKGLDKADKCFSSNNLIKSNQEIKTAVLRLVLNSRAKVAVMYGSSEDDLVAFEEAKRLNITDIIWINTNSWRERLDQIRPYARQVEGMITVETNMPDPQGFKSYIKNEKSPFFNRKWFKETLVKMGAPAKCGEAGAAMPKADQDKCKQTKEKLKKEILKYNEATSYAIDAVYTIANGIQTQLLDTNQTSLTLLAAMKQLDFESPVTHNKIKFHASGSVMAESFLVYNMQGNRSSSMQNIRVGSWKRSNDPKINLNKVVISWKSGSKAVPISTCSRDCVKGEKIKRPSAGPKCCWLCQKCLNLTMSNRTNSQCFECPSLETPNPEKTKCVAFKQLHMRLSNPMAQFGVFLLVIGLLYIFIAMFIFNQNKECGVVIMADNATMQGLLLGCILVLLAAMPLYMKPSVNVCMAYVCAFNVALTIPLAALFTKTYFFRCIFYKNDDTLKSCSRPGLLVSIVIILLQVALLAIGLMKEKVFLLYDDTDQWDVKYVECSSFRGYLFWFSYGYNILLSVVITGFNMAVPVVEARFGEYHWLCLTTIFYYSVAFCTITICFAVSSLAKIEGLIILSMLHAFVFLVGYIFPKTHMVLFMQQDTMQELTGPQKSAKAPLMYKHHEDEELMQMVAHAGGGDIFKQKNIQIKVQEHYDEYSEED